MPRYITAYHWHALYYEIVQCLVGLKDDWWTWYKIKGPWPLHTRGGGEEVYFVKEGEQYIGSDFIY